MDALLALEDGTIFRGRAFGASFPAHGEVVFNTGMSGYQEILSDPSYAGQIVVLTAPQIGNYGVNPEDMESSKIHARGLVIRELSPCYSNHRARQSLGQLLKEHGVFGLAEVDTRALTLRLRSWGVMRGACAASAAEVAAAEQAAIERARSAPLMEGADLVREVTCKAPFAWLGGGEWQAANQPKRRTKVAALDFGMKRNILRALTDCGCEVKVFPAATPARDLLAERPDGIFLSNGPGDPAAVTYAVETVRSLLGKVPLFGICLGHQVLGLALGGKTFKLPFGHRGANHPVLERESGRVAITSQNHGFAIESGSLDPEQVEVTHLNLNDKTIEGIKHRRFPAFGVQFHPESSPGPRDGRGLFDRFAALMESSR